MIEQRKVLEENVKLLRDTAEVFEESLEGINLDDPALVDCILYLVYEKGLSIREAAKECSEKEG